MFFSLDNGGWGAYIIEWLGKAVNSYQIVIRACSIDIAVNIPLNVAVPFILFTL